MEKNEGLRSRIRKELDLLRSNFNGNSERVNEIINLFIEETPDALAKISENIRQENWIEAGKLIHKIKTRYSYIGLDEVTTFLANWENNISQNTNPKENQENISRMKEKTNEVIRELKETKYYQREEEPAIDEQPLRGKVVLIAEDDEVNAMVFDLFVKETGASTILAADGIQALRLASEEKPDLIFMDVHMPFYSGLDVIRDLRRVGFAQPIVSLSASTRLNEQQNSLDAGANEFLIKPANRASITKVLRKYLIRE